MIGVKVLYCRAFSPALRSVTLRTYEPEHLTGFYLERYIFKCPEFIYYNLVFRRNYFRVFDLVFAEIDTLSTLIKRHDPLNVVDELVLF